MSGFNAYLYVSVVMCLVLGVICEMTVNVAYSVLERRIETLELDTHSGLAKLNDRMDTIEMLIKSHVTTQTPPNKESVSVPGNKQVTGNNEVRKFKTTILKAFASEKQLIRNALEKCEEQFNDFKQTIDEQMRQINESHEAIHHEHVNTIVRVNDSLTQFHFDTDLKLQGIVATFETSLNDTEVTLEAAITKQEEIQTLTGAIVNDLKSHDMNISNIQSGLNSLDDRHSKDVSSIRSSVNSLESQQRSDKYYINSAISSINSGMSSIRRDISSTKSDLSSTKSSLSYAKSDLSSIKSSLSSAKSDISSLRSRINTLEDKRVGFTARLTYKRNYKRSQIIVFNELESSYGGGYSTSTGVFTAPKTGLYLFQFNVEACTLENLHASLIARGNLRVSGMVDFGPNKAATNAAVAYLYRGDTAYVRVASLDSTYCIYPYRSSFTGVLID